jgi:hypothetical protein
MAEYLFTGAFPRVMFGLSQGVNAWHRPASGGPSELVEGQTIVLEPGDRLRTDGDYTHPELSIIPEPVEDTPAEPPAPATKPARTGAKA